MLIVSATSREALQSTSEKLAEHLEGDLNREVSDLSVALAVDRNGDSHGVARSSAAAATS